MDECRFETSELQASFMMATPLWSASWSLCDVADRSRSIQIQTIDRIMYVAFPEVEITQPDNLVVLEVARDGPFSALSTSLPSDEPPPMVNGAIHDLFVSSALYIQSQITQGLEMEKRKQVVITGHSTGGAVAALTALWLLLQPSKPPLRLLCITFGSPSLGNQSLSSSIYRSRLAHNFCNVVSTHDLSPRRNDDLWPFGTYLFCSEKGGVCLDNAASVRRMFLILNSVVTPNIEERPRYGHYVSTLSHQFLVSRSFLGGGNISDNSYQAGVALAVESLGLSNDHPCGVSAKECIETATTISRAPILRSSELAIELGTVLRSRLEIQWYKDSCDASPVQLGYYDNFKVMAKREIRVNKSRIMLAKFWDGVLKMVENNELPFDFHLGKKWVYASQFYQLLAEPLDIACFYKYDYSRTGGHYMENGNRPKRYVVIDKWWKERGEPNKEKGVRTRYASSTQDTCFWAKLEEAKECLDDMRRESGDAQGRSLLWKKIGAFKSYADRLVEMKEVSADVLAKNSSYSVWVKNLSEFNPQMGNMVVDESNAMEIQ